MAPNLKAILSAVGVAALVASPAVAKTHRPSQPTPSLTSVPADVQASIRQNAPLVTPYAADLKVQANSTSSINPDFQLGSEK